MSAVVSNPAPMPAVRTQEAQNGERMLIVAMGAMAVIQLWFGLIASSLWLDETGTWWIVKDGPAEAVRRAFSWSGQSPFFYLLAWLSSRVFGLSEIALRLPSVLAMAGTLYFLFRIAERLYDRATAAITVLVFLLVASFYAIDARPYALALLCLTICMWGLIRWVESGRISDAAVYILAGAGLVYAHCIMSLTLGAAFIYAVAATWNQRKRLVSLLLMEAVTVLLCLPLVPQLRLFYATRSSHTFTGLPTSGDLLDGFVPCSLVGALVLLVWLWMAFRQEAPIQGKCTRLTGLLIGTWSLFAPLVLFLLPVASDLRLFVDRYYSSALPGQALLLGGLIASIRNHRVQTALLLVLAAASILVQGRMSVNSHGREDWRGAMQYLRTEAGPAPVLLVSPFAEGSDFKALREPRLHEILFSPEAMYGEPLHSIRLPHLFSYDETAELERIAEQLKGEKRFYFLNDKPDRSYMLWLLGHFGTGCKAETLDRGFGFIWIARFTCATQS
jgi:mannosyltransferase